MVPNINSDNNGKIKSIVEEKIELLINEASQIPCDDSSVDPKKLDQLPIWFDEDKFKRGQKFFHDNVFVMLFGKFCGLLTILIRPTILKILQLTNMSSTPLTAYKRYMATLLHMTVWYDEDFKPGSDLWKSIKMVRNLHFSASKRAMKNNLNFISQFDMVITQFGFMGYILTRSKTIGLYNIKDEELEGFIHVWRVVGYLLGIEDRFNLCSGNLQETREFCNEIINKILKPELKKADEDFHKMSFVLLDGMTVFQPFLNYSVAMTYIHNMCDISIEENTSVNKFIKTNWYAKLLYYFTVFNLYTYHWFLFKQYHNYLQHFALYYIIQYFPFLAYFKFGFKNGKLNPIFKKQM